MQVQLKPWGNSQGIRLTKEMLEAAGFRSGDVLEVTVSGQRLTLSKPFAHRTLAERAADYGGKLFLSEELERGEPSGSEVW